IRVFIFTFPSIKPNLTVLLLHCSTALRPMHSMTRVNKVATSRLAHCSVDLQMTWRIVTSLFGTVGSRTYSLLSLELLACFFSFFEIALILQRTHWRNSAYTPATLVL